MASVQLCLTSMASRLLLCKVTSACEGSTDLRTYRECAADRNSHRPTATRQLAAPSLGFVDAKALTSPGFSTILRHPSVVLCDYSAISTCVIRKHWDDAGPLSASRSHACLSRALSSRHFAATGDLFQEAAASVSRASVRMRSTMARRPLERCGVRCSRNPNSSNTAIASVDRISCGVRPE